jgi:hypothetical protein
MIRNLRAIPIVRRAGVSPDVTGYSRRNAKGGVHPYAKTPSVSKLPFNTAAVSSYPSHSLISVA